MKLSTWALTKAIAKAMNLLTVSYPEAEMRNGDFSKLTNSVAQKINICTPDGVIGAMVTDPPAVPRQRDPKNPTT